MYGTDVLLELQLNNQLAIIDEINLLMLQQSVTLERIENDVVILLVIGALLACTFLVAKIWGKK